MFYKGFLTHWSVVSFVLIIFIAASRHADASKRERKYGCVVPRGPKYGFIVFNDNRKSLTYECFDGFYLDAIRQKPRRCRRGKWTGKPIDCIYIPSYKKKCPTLRDPDNGHVITEGREDGDQAHFFCYEGYHVEGSRLVTCRGGEYWDGTLPICQSHRTPLDVAMNFKDKVVHTLSATTAQSDSDVQARLSPGKNGLDILFLMDTSSSIGKRSLAIAKGFMCRLVDIFKVSNKSDGGGNGTRFALLTFSSQTKTIFSYNDPGARSEIQVKQRIDGIESTGGGTNIQEALAIAVGENMMNQRPGSTRALFIITDAEHATDTVMDSEARKDIVDIALSLKTSGVEIFAIGVGKSVDKTLIADIASDPYYEHVFYLDKFQDLSYIGDVISEQNIDYGQCGVSGNTATAQGMQHSKPGALPWLGWLSVFGEGTTSWTCGGALLCDRWFMTAASCVTTLDSNGTVVALNSSQIHLTLGDTKLYEVDGTETYPVIHDVLIHDNYTGEMVPDTEVREYDIALLDLGENETERPVLHKFIRPLCVPVDNTSQGLAELMLDYLMAFPDVQNGYVAGWGHSPDNFKHIKMPFATMMQMEQPVTKAQLCQNVYPALDKDKFFCLGQGFEKSEICRGDRGGPFMVKMQNKLFSGLGLNLATHNCERAQQFSVFLNLNHPSITDWMVPILDGCNRNKLKRDVETENSSGDKDEGKNYCAAI